MTPRTTGTDVPRTMGSYEGPARVARETVEPDFRALFHASPAPLRRGRATRSSPDDSVALHSYLEREPVGAVFMSPADISWGVDTLVQPDVFVVPIQEARTLAWPSMRTLMLAVEILSPSSVRADRFTKRRLYQEVGVSVYWVIDADAATAEIWMPSDQLPRTEIDRLVWSPPDASQPFEVSLAELLRPL